MDKISVVVKVCGNPTTMERALRSVKDFDEVVVMDRTGDPALEEIVARNGARLQHLVTAPADKEDPRRNTLLHDLKHNWILVMWSDEVVPDELRRFCYEYIHSDPQYVGLYIPRKNYMLGRFLKSTYPDYQMRLFRKDKADVAPRLDAAPILNGPTEHVRFDDTHLAVLHPGSSFRADTRAMNVTTDLEADRFEGGKIRFADLVFSPAWSFTTSYILNGGWRYGSPGFIRSCRDAYARFLLLAKIYEKQHPNLIEVKDDKAKV